LAGLTALALSASMAVAQPSTPAVLTLSIGQQNELSEIITNRTPNPLGPTDFTVAVGATVSPNISLQPLPPAAAALAPQLQGKSRNCRERVMSPSKNSSRSSIRIRGRSSPYSKGCVDRAPPARDIERRHSQNF